METAVATAFIGLVGGLLVASFTYWLTKRRERDAEWRKEKLAYYKTYVECLSGVVEGDDTPEGHRLYARATNNLLLFAPQPVIEALNSYRSANAFSNKERSTEKHDKLLAELLFAIRKDIGVHPGDDPQTFKPMLWASGVRKSAT